MHCAFPEIAGKTDWNQIAKNTLNEALRVQPNMGIAKNVIMMIGDGMGISTINAARIYKGQKQGNPGEETVQEFEKFPYVALSKVMSYVFRIQTLKNIVFSNRIFINFEYFLMIFWNRYKLL
jgi:alkaline phosphatase